MGKKIMTPSSTRLAPMSIKLDAKLKAAVEKAARDEERTASNHVQRILRAWHTKKGYLNEEDEEQEEE